MNMSPWIKWSATTSILTLAGIAAAQPIVDGFKDPADGYGPAFAVQTATVIDFEGAPRVKISANSDQSNVGGKGEYAIAGTQSAPDESDPTLVNRGVEIAIRLADLPGQGTAFPGNMIKVAGFISGGDFASNQFIGGLDGDPGNIGSLRNMNFETGHSGKQYIAVSTTTRSPLAPTIDGIRSEAAYGPRAPQINVGTGFGSNSINPPAKNAGNGSELNGSYAYIWDNGSPGNPNDDVLVLFFAGNLEPNFNRLNLFIDCTAGGQNTIRRDNSGQGFNALIRWGENLDGTNPQASGDVGPGLTFDSDCSPDIWLSINHGGNGPASTNAIREGYCDSATLATGGGGPGTFFGPEVISTTAGTPAAGPVAGSVPGNADAVRFEIDNSNSSGAMAVAPNNGGVGGRANLPGGGSQMDTTDPATVGTGMEFKIDLLGAGWDGVSPVGIAGMIFGFNWDYGSNQAIGGLTSMDSPDPGNLGFPAKDIDFNSWDGNQFVSVAVPGMIPAQPAGAAVDGRINSSAAETTAYGSPLWVNTTNASAFGNSVASMTFTPGPDRSAGSKLNAVYAYIANDPTNSNKPTLYVLATGNLHDFNKLILFLDTDPAEGQADIRGDNFNIGNFNTGLGGPDGFTFDAGFTADYAVSYEIGYNNDAMQAEHFLNATQLLTDGGGFGGNIGGGVKTGVGSPITGEIIARVGFGSNDLAPTPVLMAPNFYDRSIRSNGTELNAIYLYPDTNEMTLYIFLAGNLEPNLTSVEIFFDTVAGGQNQLVGDFRDSQDPMYVGNPSVDFGALQNMGPSFDEMMMVVDPGLRFDAGFEADYYYSFRAGDFVQSEFDSTPGVGAFQIYGNYARLRTLADAVGPMPSDAARFLGSVVNDVYLGPTGFANGDQPEAFTEAALDNRNLGGIGGGRSFVCQTDPSATNPASVNYGLELKIDMFDIDWDGVSPMKMSVFVNGSGHSNVSNQFLGRACVNDLGNPRVVNLANIPGPQFVSFPMPQPAATPCRQEGDSNMDGFVDFDDLVETLANWLDNYLPGTGPGDANGDGIVDFDDLVSTLGAWLQGAQCNP